ncbi:MAG: hypothetical protein KA310_03595 [Pseudomonadales bacterium]|nr:hypothetical protein [Pseudomonadales bacterium]
MDLRCSAVVLDDASGRWTATVHADDVLKLAEMGDGSFGPATEMVAVEASGESDSYDRAIAAALLNLGDALAKVPGRPKLEWRWLTEAEHGFPGTKWWAHDCAAADPEVETLKTLPGRIGRCPACGGTR